MTEEALASGAEAARTVARRTDLVGWLEDGSILIVMPETSQEQAKIALFRWQNEMLMRTVRKWRFAAVEDTGDYRDPQGFLRAAAEHVKLRDAA